MQGMGYIKKYRFSASTVLIILLCMFFFSTCIDKEKDKTKDAAAVVNYNSYSGSASCVNCHKTIYESHINTAHFHTSEIASEKTIRGSFDVGQNTFTYTSGGVVRMEKAKDSLYQVAYIRGAERIRQHFDIVTGSGTKGQTYLNWSGENLYQLPVSYFTTASSWCNSPGMPNKIVYFRPITSRCLECHTTYAEKLSPEKTEPELFDKGRMILGVDCEKCHGPAARHVEFQTQNPTEKKGMFIINPATFTRKQSLDLCALCHGGRLQKTKPSFQFTAGDKLSDYFLIDSTAKDASNIDVHGNQYGLLAASKCFQRSTTLTCITCHNAHENEQGKTEIFSQRCINCHNNDHADGKLCKMTSTISAEELKKNCTKCHMPQLPSKAIAVLLQGNDTLTPATMHTHLIKNYPDETRKVLAFIKAGQSLQKNDKH